MTERVPRPPTDPSLRPPESSPSLRPPCSSSSSNPLPAVPILRPPPIPILRPPPIPIFQPPKVPLPTVVLARELAPAAVRVGVRTGVLERVRPGAYRAPRTDPAITPAAAARELALARIAAAARSLQTTHWFSHESAALVWGCPVWAPPTQTHIIQNVRPSQHGDPLLTRHVMTLAEADQQEWRGVRVTSLDRTVVDCLLRLPPLDALVIADGALRLGADRAGIAGRLIELEGRRGVVGARSVFDLADGRAESAWETFVRYVLMREGLPRPELQIVIHTRLGSFRADLGWHEWKLVLEFDGFVKYSQASGVDANEVLFKEKRRQEAIEEEGWSVLRFTANDRARPGDLFRRVRRRLPREVTANLRPLRFLPPR